MDHEIPCCKNRSLQKHVRYITDLRMVTCSFIMSVFQAKHSGDFLGSDEMIHNQNINVPPASHPIGDLEPHSPYAVRVACHSSQGPSEWTPWVELRTKEGGKSLACFHHGCCVQGITSTEVGQGWGWVIYIYCTRSKSRPPPAPTVHSNQCRPILLAALSLKR